MQHGSWCHGVQAEQAGGRWVEVIGTSFASWGTAPPWSWDPSEGSNQALLHLYWARLWWRNWNTSGEYQNASPTSLTTTCQAICCCCQGHLGKSLLGWAAGIATMGRAKMTSHQPEATVASRNCMQSCSHSDQVYCSQHTAVTREEGHLTELTYVISLYNFIFNMPGEVVWIDILTLILWLLKNVFSCSCYSSYNCLNTENTFNSSKNTEYQSSLNWLAFLHFFTYTKDFTNFNVKSIIKVC